MKYIKYEKFLSRNKFKYSINDKFIKKLHIAKNLRESDFKETDFRKMKKIEKIIFVKKLTYQDIRDVNWFINLCLCKKTNYCYLQLIYDELKDRNIKINNNKLFPFKGVITDVSIFLYLIENKYYSDDILKKILGFNQKWIYKPKLIRTLMIAGYDDVLKYLVDKYTIRPNNKEFFLIESCFVEKETGSKKYFDYLVSLGANPNEYSVIKTRESLKI